MYAAALRVELRVPNVQSLKEKRHTMRSLISYLTTKHPVSVAEVDHQDLWQRATLGIAVVAAQAGHLERIIHTVERGMRARTDIEVLEVGVSYLEEPA